MADTPVLTPYVIPTGGIIGITFVTAITGSITLSRAVSGSGGLGAFTTLLSGSPINKNQGNCTYLDMGDFLPGGVLLGGQQYVYRLTDANGTITSTPITPVSSIQLDRIDYIPIFISLIQGAINNVQFPNGVLPARALQAMPLQGIIPFPFVVINPDLVQQNNVPIGQSVTGPGQGTIQPNASNTTTQTEFARRVFRVSVFSQNAVERDFYRDFIISVFKVSLGYVFQELGVDMQHHYQASSFQTAEVQQGTLPGFYGCDIMLELVGTSNVSIISNYSLIETITTAITGSLGSVTSTNTNTSG